MDSVLMGCSKSDNLCVDAPRGGALTGFSTLAWRPWTFCHGHNAQWTGIVVASTGDSFCAEFLIKPGCHGLYWSLAAL
jgi:hypothetical protein